MLPIRITDDRGEPVELYSPARKSLLVGSYTRENAGLGVIREAVGGRMRRGLGWWVGAVLSGFAALFFLFLAYLLLRRGDVFTSVFILVLVAYAFFEMIIRRWFRRWRHREEIARALRTVGRCAACGYDTSGLTRDDAGLVTCPECGGAWRADRRRADEGEYTRWERPRPWITKFVRDDRGWRARMKYGLRPSLIGFNARRRRTVFRLCGWLSVASYVAGWLALFALIGLVVASFVYENGWLVLWGVGLGLGLALVQSILWLIARNVHSERIRLTLLEGGMCPCCDERLPANAEPNGRRVCENCGTAWLTS